MPLLKTEYSTPRRSRRAAARARADAEVFSADAQVLPSTANAKDGTIDVVWYSGAFVPRIDRSTGEPYMLKLDMQGCRFDRLNNGAPVFDTHFTGDDFKSLIAGQGRHARPGGRRAPRLAQRRQGHGYAAIRSRRSGRRRDVPQGQHRHPPESQLRHLHLQARKDRHADGGDAGGQAAVPERQGNRHVQGHRLGAV